MGVKGKVIIPLFLFSLLYLLWSVSYAAPFIKNGNIKLYYLYKDRTTYDIVGNAREITNGLQLPVADKDDVPAVEIQSGSNVVDGRKEVSAKRGNGDVPASIPQGINSTIRIHANEIANSGISCSPSRCRESAEEETECIRTKPA